MGRLSEKERKKLTAEEIIEEAKALVKETKEVMSTLYKLAFVATSNSPQSQRAWELIQDMMQAGLVYEKQVEKAFKDVERWRKQVLDRGFVEKALEEEEGGEA
jgi:transcription initiation factor IIE alpha subunit